ncbi:MAG: 3'-5' exonuclease [Thermoanaerobaculales bacterium]|nr:3'-5' exonuclease [Thermoanaerobaculales bacterium]
MFKTVHDRVWAFDMEWVPDPTAGKLLYPEKTAAAKDNAEIMRVMWDEGGATEEDPTPFLKTALCRIVSVAAVTRQAQKSGAVALNLVALPHDPSDPEKRSESSVVGLFLDALGEHHPQLVGYNSRDSDLKILVQRALILGLSAPGFCRRPNKPWEGVDYFARGSEANVDLKEIVGGWGLATPSLHQMAVQCGIPGRMEIDGNQVAALWLDGKFDEIVQYNEFDALTTYLVWLRMAHLGGFFTKEAYLVEQNRVEELINTEIEAGRAHLATYQAEWERLRVELNLN